MTGPDPGSGPARESIATRVVRRLAEASARLTYREIEVVVAGEPGPGPVLIVSNHFGGVADAVLLIFLSRRFPRIVARDMIWSFPVAGRLMRSIRAIPVHKAEDAGDGRSTNDAMFSSCYQALDEGALVLIFPEGVTQDDPYLAPVKTGAARIALGARAAGTPGISIQPVGIHYEDKAAFRSRVLVAFGAPIDLDEAVDAMDPSDGPASADNRATVDELNDAIIDGMTNAAPNYRDWDEASELQLSATVTLRQTTVQEGADIGDVPLALSEQLGARLGAREPERRRPVQEAVRRYRASLAGLRISDYQLSGSTSTARLVGRLAVDGLLMLLLLPYAVIGVVLGAIPYLLVQATRLIPAAPAVRATILPLAALVVFLAEWVWLAVAVGNARGVWFGALVALLVPVFLGATVIVGERAVLVWRTVRSWVAARRFGEPITAARQQRVELLDAVRRAL